MMNDFTVLLPVYYRDCPQRFQAALDSVVRNCVKPTELLIVADGPLTIELDSVINSFHSEVKFNVLRLSNNCGLAAALNKGLEAIRTTYTIRADADDINHPHRFKLLMEKLVAGFDVVGSAVNEVDVDGSVIALKRCPLEPFEIRKFVKRRNPFNHMSVGFRTASVKSVGGYPEFFLREDYGLWAKMLVDGAKVCNLEQTLVNATTGSEFYSRRGGLKYALGEIRFQRYLADIGIKSISEAIFDGFLRFFVFVSPSFLRRSVYLRLLRR